MAQIEFKYTNQRPPAARPGSNTNLIGVWRDENGCVNYSRSYVSADGSVSSPIEHKFEANATATDIAKMIHWGCCGWSAGLHEIHTLYTRILEWQQSN